MATAAEALDASIEGSLNILRQAEKAGVRHFAFVSSIVSVTNLQGPNRPLTDQDWNPSTREQALDGTHDPFFIYAVEKTLAEHAVWDFADKHPHIEVTTVNPPFFFGPFAPGYRNPTASISALSTNSMIYNFIRPEGGIPPHPSHIDVRDVARGLVAALRSPPTSQVGRKRILMSGEWFSPKDAVDYIAEVRPELKGRLSEQAKAAGPVPKSTFNDGRAEEVLGLEFSSWKKTVIDAVDDLLRLEKEWEAKGLVPA